MTQVEKAAEALLMCWMWNERREKAWEAGDPQEMNTCHREFDKWQDQWIQLSMGMSSVEMTQASDIASEARQQPTCFLAVEVP